MAGSPGASGPSATSMRCSGTRRCDAAHLRGAGHVEQRRGGGLGHGLAERAPRQREQPEALLDPHRGGLLGARATEHERAAAEQHEVVVEQPAQQGRRLDAVVLLEALVGVVLEASRDRQHALVDRRVVAGGEHHVGHHLEHRPPHQVEAAVADHAVELDLHERLAVLALARRPDLEEAPVG